jgi:hypothetical protein
MTVGVKYTIGNHSGQVSCLRRQDLRIIEHYVIGLSDYWSLFRLKVPGLMD